MSTLEGLDFVTNPSIPPETSLMLLINTDGNDSAREVFISPCCHWGYDKLCRSAACIFPSPWQACPKQRLRSAGRSQPNSLGLHVAAWETQGWVDQLFT